MKLFILIIPQFLNWLPLVTGVSCVFWFSSAQIKLVNFVGDLVVLNISMLLLKDIIECGAKAVHLKHPSNAVHVVFILFILDSTVMFLHCCQHLGFLIIVVSVNVLSDGLKHVDFELVTELSVFIVDVVV